MAVIPTQELNVEGVTVTLTAAASAGDTFIPTLRTFLMVTNGGGSSTSLVVDDPRSVSPVGATEWNPDVTIEVPAGATRYAGPFHPHRFAGASGYASVTYVSSSGVSVAVLAV